LALPDRTELRAAGFRVLPDLSDRQLLAVSHRWLLGLALSTLLLPTLGLPANPALQGMVGGLAVALATTATWYWHRPLFPLQTARRLRSILHLHLALILLILLTDSLL
jgi:predicted membrane-bound spermidine synthase